MSETSHLFDNELITAFQHGCSVAATVDARLAAVPNTPAVVGSPSWFYLGAGRELTLRYVPVDTGRKLAGVLLDGTANLRYGLRGQPNRVGTLLQAQVVEQSEDGLRSCAVRMRRQADSSLHDRIAVGVQRGPGGYKPELSNASEVQTVVSAIKQITAEDNYFREKVRSAEEMKHLRQYAQVKVNTLLPRGGLAILRQEQADGSVWNYQISRPAGKLLALKSKIVITPSEPDQAQRYDGLEVELQGGMLRQISGIDARLTAEYRGGRSPVLVDGERSAVIHGLVSVLTKLPNNVLARIRPLEAGDVSPQQVIQSSLLIK